MQTVDVTLNTKEQLLLIHNVICVTHDNLFLTIVSYNKGIKTVYMLKHSDYHFYQIRSKDAFKIIDEYKEKE